MTGKTRNTIERAVHGLGFKREPKNSKCYIASELLEYVYLGYSTLSYWQNEHELKWQEANGFEWPKEGKQEQVLDEREPEDVQ